ncbi:unnamed protein product [Brugia timori]|uniref:MgtE domain-containing protein n=1 Tax=Brugia timori TaxID=42155 RepID=A0A0R3QT67_9BILA|nr:unnamed protein product [Brugia timori]
MHDQWMEAMKIRRQYDESKLLQVKRRRFRGENSKMDVGNVNSDLDGLETKFELNSVFVSASRGGPSYKPEVTDSKFNNDIVTDSIPMLKRMREMLNSNIARGETSLVFNSGDSIQVASDEDFSFTHANILDSSMSTTSSYSLFLQILFPFVPAGLGMVFAGFVLDIVQHWNLFIEVPETFILVPALLGLKGNLEMTFASRLSTLANMGRMNSNPKKIIVANLALIQVQAIVVAFLASSFAVTLAWIPKGQIDWSHASLLCASSLTTASLTSLVLSTVVICVVLISRNFDINPDNIATPIAASLGDLTTLGALSLLGNCLVLKR